MTLTKTRRKQGKVFFGVHTTLANAIKGTRAGIRIGDRVTAIARKESDAEAS